jgi:membrane-anchored protein YejM (alkaline phosphatase superfamily)
VASAYRQASIQKSATSLPYFFPLTMNRLLDRMGLISLDEIDRIAHEVHASDLAYPIHPIVAEDSIPGYNMLLIVVDSWNTRSLDSITTPNIYRMARQHQYFDNHNAVSYGTRENIFGIFFGLSFTYEKDFIITRKSPLLIDRLVHLNYAIQVFPSAKLPSPPFHEILFRKAPHVHSRTEGSTPLEKDRKITRSAIDFMDEQISNGKPFFNFVFYDLPHAMALPKEYLLPQFEPSWTVADYMKLNNNTDPVPFFNFYRNCVHQVDLQIGILLEYVQNAGLMDNTVIIITGDHSQEFNENRKNYWGHGSNFSKWQIHVPFILYYPGMENAKQFSHTTTHYDIVPTLMNRYLGVKNPSADYSMGYDLHDTTGRYPHVVGDHVNYGFVFENMIIRTNHLGSMSVTDNALNDLPRNAVNVKELQKAIEKKNMFYK